MTIDLQLVGFAADIVGSENEITEAAPAFVRSDDQERVYVAKSLDWTVADSSELLVGDEQYVHFIRSAYQARLLEGETVWIAGRAFSDSVRSSSWTSRTASAITGWDTLSNGFRWSLGHRTRFRELIVALSNGLEQGLHHCLFDALEKSHGDAEKLNAVYSSLPLPASPRQLVNRALYARERRDDYSLEFIRTLAVEVEGTHDSLEGFDQDVERLRQELRQPRLSELDHNNNDYGETYLAAAKNLASFYSSSWNRIMGGNERSTSREALIWMQHFSGLDISESRTITGGPR